MTYIVTEKAYHSGRLLEPGDILKTFTDAWFEKTGNLPTWLERAKQGGQSEVVQKTVACPPTKDSAPITDNAILQALERLNHKDDAHWTKAGLANVNVLTEAIGRKITREDVKTAAPNFKRIKEEDV